MTRATETLREEPPGSEPQTPLLIYVLGYDQLLTEESRIFSIDEPRLPLEIGRGDELTFERAELRLPDRWLSGSHALLERQGERLLLRDTGSRNGTAVNGARIESHFLSDGDLIEVGHSLLCYRLVGRSLAVELPRRTSPRTLCAELVALLGQVDRIAPSTEPVLLLAETGAGKERFAETIHAWSGRRGPFCAIDCGAIPENLFESTLFGHQRGAFTGATEARTGELVRAHRGTLFLDEVGNLSLSAQAKLLRVLEDQRVTPLGAAQPIQVDVRIIAATNRDLYADDTGFRPDLLRRLAGFVARLPPLRRRREDLGILVADLLGELGAKRAAITAAAARQLFCDPFPGNVRQLRTALRAAALLAGDGPIDLHHLPPPTEKDAAPAPRVGEEPAPQTTPSMETIEQALAAASGNVVRAARALTTHPRQLYRWIARYQISLDRFRG